MRDIQAFFRSAPLTHFSGTVFRLCPAVFGSNLVSMRGALLHGARFNIKGHFGALYTSLTPDTAQREMAQYFTVPPIGGFVQASIGLRLTRVVDLTDPALLADVGVTIEQLIGSRYAITQEFGLRAWENRIEALLVPSAVRSSEHNLAVFLDNQFPAWRIELAETMIIDVEHMPDQRRDT